MELVELLCKSDTVCIEPKALNPRLYTALLILKVSLNEKHRTERDCICMKFLDSLNTRSTELNG